MLALPDIMFLWRIDFDAEEQLPPNLHVFSDSLKSALGHPRVRAVLCDADATTFHEGLLAIFDRATFRKHRLASPVNICV